MVKFNNDFKKVKMKHVLLVCFIQFMDQLMNYGTFGYIKKYIIEVCMHG